MKSIFASAATALAISAVTLPAWSAQYTYESVEFPGAQTTALYAINNLRQYVGSKRDEQAIHAAIWNDGKSLQLLDLSALGPIKESWAFSINTHSDIAGQYIDLDGVVHGYVHHVDNTVDHIEFPGGNNTAAYGVNDRGTVIGVYSDEAGNPHAFERIKGVYKNIDLPNGFATTPLSVNNSNEIVGEFQPTAEVIGYGFVRNADGTFTLHNAPDTPDQSTLFISINNRREVLGAWYDADGNANNFLRKQAKYKAIALPDSFGATFTSAQTINDFNDIVGYYGDASNFAHGWTAFSKNGGIGK